MAVLPRRTWDLLRDEAINRLAGAGKGTGFSDRVQEWMCSAYWYICQTYHHNVFNKFDNTLTLATGVNTLAVPADLFIPIWMLIRNPGASTVVHALTRDHIHKVLAETQDANATPTTWARRGDVFMFDRKPDANYEVDLFYYKQPTAPDYDTPTGPEIERVWDEYIIQLTLAMGWPGTWRFDFGQLSFQTLADFLQKQIQPPLLSGISEMPERPLVDQSAGGAQG